MRTNKYGPHSNIFQIAHNLIFNFNFNSNTTSNTISTYIIRRMSLSYDNIYTTSTRVSSYATSTRVSRHAISTRVTNDILCGPKFNFLKMRTDRRNISEVRIFFDARTSSSDVGRTIFRDRRISRSTNLRNQDFSRSTNLAIDKSTDCLFSRSTEFFCDRRNFSFTIDGILSSRSMNQAIESSDRIKRSTNFAIDSVANSYN